MRGWARLWRDFPAQLEAVAQSAGGGCETLLLPGCGHSPHRDQRDAVLDAAARLMAAFNQLPGTIPGASADACAAIAPAVVIQMSSR